MAEGELSKYSRQLRLQEIGAAGQELILKAPLIVDRFLDDAALRDAKLYASAAGLKADEVRTEESCLSQSVRECFRHPSSSALGFGASSALGSIHRALHLELGPTTR